ncbi:unnamed protein product [Peronospora destructor]|uniref:CCHC-type domain-containing protein n=1 Tax=Peronospora destructor TaxID=86335 RepID=A0AAV0UVJ5_9STRA|nr:unnamed protein product [Peronospora destructor]
MHSELDQRVTRAEPSSLEEAFALALREDCEVASSYAHPMLMDAMPSGPEPMEIDTIESSDDRRRMASNRSTVRKGRSMTCYRCRKQGHRAALCRAPAPVLAQAAAVGHDDASGSHMQKIGTSRRQLVLQAPPSPSVLHAQSNATTASDDTRLIIASLYVAGSRQPLRALLDSGSTKKFFRASRLSLLPKTIPVRAGLGEVVVKLADGKPCRVARHELLLSYTFDGFRSNDDFLVIDMNYVFDCILVSRG